MEDAPLTTTETSKKSNEDGDDKSSKKKKLGNKLVAKAEERRGESPDRPEKPVVLMDLFKDPEKKVKPASEAEAPDGKMGKNEKSLVASALAEQASKEVPKHAPGAEINPNVAADMVASAYYDRLIETGDIEGAAADTAAELDIPADEVVVGEDTEQEAVADIEDESHAGPDAETDVENVEFEADAEDVEPELEPEPETAGLPEVDEGIVFERIVGNNSVNETEETPVADGTNPSPATPRSSIPPPQPVGAVLLPTSFELPSYGESSNSTRAEAVAPNSPRATEKRDQNKSADPALKDGIVDYLIGRRQGRSKDEKKQLSVQKKLEKQVENVHWQIKAQESKLRSAAADKYARDGYIVRGPWVVRPEKSESTSKPIDAKNTEQIKKPEQRDIAELSENQAAEQRRRAPEASQLHGAGKAHEHIGHMLVTAIESAPTSTHEKPLQNSSGESNISSQKQSEQKSEQKPEQKPDRIAERLRERRVETLSRAELLALSGNIVVDGSSLRQIYETHLIGERGLRRLVAEHLHGGNLKKALRREIVEREIDFERDPALRDMTPQSMPSGAAAVKTSGKDALDKLLESASAGFGDSNDQAAFFKARDDYDSNDKHKGQKNHRLVDISITATVATIAALILILLISGH